MSDEKIIENICNRGDRNASINAQKHVETL